MKLLKKVQKHLLIIVLNSAIFFGYFIYAQRYDETLSAAHLLNIIGGIYGITTTASLFLLYMSLVDLKKRIRSVLDLAAMPSNVSDGLAFDLITKCEDEEWRLLVARVCATNVNNQDSLERLIVRLSQDNAGQEIIQVFLDRLHRQFDTSLDRHFKDLLFNDGSPWTGGRADKFFLRLNKMILLDGTDYAKIESIGATVTVFLREHPISGVSLLDMLNQLLSYQNMNDQNVPMDGHQMSAFLQGAWNEAHSPNLGCQDGSIGQSKLTVGGEEDHF